MNNNKQPNPADANRQQPRPDDARAREGFKGEKPQDRDAEFRGGQTQGGGGQGHAQGGGGAGQPQHKAGPADQKKSTDRQQG